MARSYSSCRASRKRYSISLRSNPSNPSTAVSVPHFTPHGFTSMQPTTPFQRLLLSPVSQEYYLSIFATMLTPTQYTKLEPHKAVITFIAEGGGSAIIPMEIYNMAGELNLYLDMTCNGCKINYIKDLYNLLLNYEETNGR